MCMGGAGSSPPNLSRRLEPPASDAALAVPNLLDGSARDGSVLVCSSLISYLGALFSMFSAKGFGLLRTDAPRLTMLPDVLEPESALSDSGGGVGGNTLRLRGGSDCCLLLDSPGLTRFAAA